MRKPVWVVIGVVLMLLGLVFTLQGAGVINGSAMSGSTFWEVAGPVIILAGLAMAGIGVRGRLR
ncbi:MAG TPA: hypothetical protein VGH11_06845 [Jatrophihabitans sp.]|jgi:uncharacterized membrane-anchored protein YitT (DUF2179 family)